MVDKPFSSAHTGVRSSSGAFFGTKNLSVEGAKMNTKRSLISLLVLSSAVFASGVVTADPVSVSTYVAYALEHKMEVIN